MSTEQAIKILLVDDRKEDLLSMEVILANANYTFYKASSGREALRILLKDKDFAIILMDVQMPHMDGFAATASIREKERENDSHTLIVAMTAHAFPEDEIRCRAAGMDAYISKPIDMKQCIELIEDLIGKRDLEA